ncbi:hypothetical protein TRVA0_014S01332 [Trichomonascus vanleenenianus]|uniref:polynucleotide 5'-hydroxyl-kinase n=1 Tax=Trichomonascus vanleenenianus TaxID=2268995 RepID=UPI003ECB8E42
MKRKSALEALSARKSPRFDSDANSPMSSGGEMVIDSDFGPDQPEMQSLVAVSSFKPSETNMVRVNKPKGLNLGLLVGESIVINGQCRLTVQKGAIKLLGATIHANKKSYSVYSLPTHSLTRIECIQVEDLGLVEESVTPENDKLMSAHRAVILLEPLYSGIEAIGSVAPPYKNLVKLADDEFDTFEIIYQAPGSTPIFNVLRSWTSAAASIWQDCEDTELPKKPVIFVVGPKSSGKSSFCRTLLNYLVSKLNEQHPPSAATQTVSYLDLDPGQPEYCPPGTISLQNAGFNFGPSYTHRALPLRAHCLGDVSPKDEPGLYLSYMRDLFKVYSENQKVSEAPLIINTPGWTRGLGLDLLVQISNETQPTHIIFLGPEDSQEQIFGALGRPDARCMTPEMVGLQQISPRYTSTDIRNLHLLCYLYNYDFSSHMTEVSPYELPYKSSSSDADGAISGVLIQQDDGIDSTDVALALNGTMVAVMAVDKDTDIQTDGDVDGLPYITNPTHVLAPSASHTLGCAIIQSIDTENKLIRLLTPLSPESLPGAQLILVRGRLTLPVWMYWTPSLAQKFDQIPYLSNTKSIGAGSMTPRVRRNIQRGRK